MQTSAMGTCSQIAECSLSYAKIMQTSAMRTCSQIAECSLSSAKISKSFHIWKVRDKKTVLKKVKF